MASIATRLVPDGKGTHIRFINSNKTSQDLNADQIDQMLQFDPDGGTNIRTNLTKRILEPMICDELDKSGGAKGWGMRMIASWTQINDLVPILSRRTRLTTSSSIVCTRCSRIGYLSAERDATIVLY